MKAEDVIAVVRERGPLTGAELRDALPGDVLTLWRTCIRSSELLVSRVGQRYLRLDRKVEGFARLSPSILREFMTYTIVGLRADPQAVERRARAVLAHAKEVTKMKRELAHTTVVEIVASLGTDGLGADRFCVLLAGDIVYEMAHDVPRPERSTGKLVRGSDLDLVFIVDDDVPEAMVRELDQAVYHKKSRLLRDPVTREEIDYIVKRVERLREQLGFDEFKRMVACKILDEGIFLHGSQSLFAKAKSWLVEYGVADKLKAMTDAAVAARGATEAQLAARESGEMTDVERQLLYTAEESEEFD